MPVQSEHYHKVKAVCDRLALTASQCSDEEFERRFQFLDAVCKSWSLSDKHQQMGVSSHDGVSCADNADVVEENLSEQSEVETVTYSEDNISVADDETLFTDSNSKQQLGVCVCELKL